MIKRHDSAENFRLRIAVADSMEASIEQILDEIPDATPLLLPSTGSRRDAPSLIVRQRLRDLGVPSSLLPYGGVVGSLPGLANEAGSWISAPGVVDISGGSLASLPDRLLRADEIWIVTDLDAVAGRGPHVLDLVARYVRRVDRLRAFRLRDATWMVPILAVLPVKSVIATLNIDGLAIAARALDVISGELAALALAETKLPGGASVHGVWEDSLIQRATELDLGARYPGEITADIAIRTNRSVANRYVRQILTSIGVPSP